MCTVYFAESRSKWSRDKLNTALIIANNIKDTSCKIGTVVDSQ